MASDNLLIKEIRSGLFSIKWDFSKEKGEHNVYDKQFTLDVFKSALTLDMRFSFLSRNKRCYYINTLTMNEFINDEEESNCSEVSPNDNESRDSFAEDANEDDESNEDDQEEDQEEEQEEEQEEQEEEQEVEQEDDHEYDPEAEEPEQHMDESLQQLPKEFKTSNCPPMHIWIYTSEPGPGTERNLSKDDSDVWKVKWRSVTKQFFITVWIDFGTYSPMERNAVKTMSGLASMFQDQLRCDVQFHFKDGKSVGAHILILSVGSPVFSAMFQSGLLESQTRQVNIDDIELEVFRQLLIYLYTGSAPKLADEDITQLLFEAADKYAIETIKGDCVEALQERMRIDNVVNFLVWSHFHSIHSLFEMALEFIVENYRELFFQADFEDFLKTFPDLCLLVMKRIASPVSP